jgi:acyl carrier protein
MARPYGASPSRGEELQEQVVEWLSQWFYERKKFSGDNTKLLNMNYFEAGLLTSLEVIEFVTEIEDKFGVRFSEQDFQDPRFVTITGLSEMVASHSAHASGRC